MTPPLPQPDQGLNSAVAAELRAERAAQKMTMSELAEASDIPFGSLRRYLGAERHIDVTVLDRIAEALGTDAGQIVLAAGARMARIDAVWDESHVIKMGGTDEESEPRPNLRAVAKEGTIEGAGDNEI